MWRPVRWCLHHYQLLKLLAQGSLLRLPYTRELSKSPTFRATQLMPPSGMSVTHSTGQSACLQTTQHWLTPHCQPEPTQCMTQAGCLTLTTCSRSTKRAAPSFFLVLRILLLRWRSLSSDPGGPEPLASAPNELCCTPRFRLWTPWLPAVTA